MSETSTEVRNDADVLCRAEGALGRITLNCPRKLNALSVAMRDAIGGALAAWQRDPMIYAVMIDAAGDNAFCSGGDLHEIHRLVRDDVGEARHAMATQFALNWQIECYTKPIVSLIDGLCMGSGVGLTAYGTHRVAGPSYAFAMPETAIGYFPDVGSTWLLGALPGGIGTYLGLSGRKISRATAFELGLVTHCIDPDHYEDIRAGLREAQPVDALLDARGLTRDDLDREADDTLDAAFIAKVFEGATLDQMFARLEADPGEFARDLLADLSGKSPISLTVTCRQFSNALPDDLGDALRREYRMACQFFETADLQEGIRAVLIDKDQNPKWQPNNLRDVPSGVVDAFFATPQSGDLELPPRPQAIAAIA